MRQNLMATFDEIYLVDLHGNSKKKEIDPATGAPDKTSLIFNKASRSDLCETTGTKVWQEEPMRSSPCASLQHAAQGKNIRGSIPTQ